MLCVARPSPPHFPPPYVSAPGGVLAYVDCPHPMSELTDIVLQSTDPVNALLLIAIMYYARQIKRELRREIRMVRSRVERLEDTYLPDEPPSPSGDYHDRRRGPGRGHDSDDD